MESDVSNSREVLVMQWMQTKSGFAFILNDPATSAAAMPLSDIFYSLARQPRYKGHTKWPYTVGQHVVLLVDSAEKMGLSEAVQRQLLWHDAEEAVIGDIPTPVKRHFPAIAEYGDALRSHFLARFGLPEHLSAIVHELDARILLDERKVLCDDLETLPWNLPYTEGLGVTIHQWEERTVIKRLWRHYHRLYPDLMCLPEGVYLSSDNKKVLQRHARRCINGKKNTVHPVEEDQNILPNLTVMGLLEQLAGLSLTANMHHQLECIRDFQHDADARIKVMGDLLLEVYRTR